MVFLKSKCYIVYPPHWKFQLSLIQLFESIGPRDPLSLQEIPIPSVREVRIFSGTAQ